MPGQLPEMMRSVSSLVRENKEKKNFPELQARISRNELDTAKASGKWVGHREKKSCPCLSPRTQCIPAALKAEMQKLNS